MRSMSLRVSASDLLSLSRAAVVIASAVNDPAPRTEEVAPLRSRVAAITGAPIGVESTAITAPRPFTLL